MTIDRKPFEAKFPVPHFAIYSESANKYVIIRNEAGASWIFRYQLDAYNNRWEAWQAAMAEAVPEGYAVVPIEPTDAMLGAGLRHVDGMACMPAAWRDMVAASIDAAIALMVSGGNSGKNPSAVAANKGGSEYD